MTLLRLLAIHIFVFMLGACASPPPIKEYNIARFAVGAAASIDAQQHAPAYWSRAERAYHRAEIYFRREEYEKALAMFKEAKLFAERAENSAAIKLMKEGGSR